MYSAFLVVLLLNSIHSEDQFDQEMLWGTYKPQLIHAVTQRRVDTYNPITISLMYFDLEYLETEKDIFYKVPERINDQVKFQVTHQDGTTLQVQDVIDPIVDFNFRTSFLKLNQNDFIDEVRNTAITSGEVLLQIQIIYTFALEQNNPDIEDNRTFQVSPFEGGYLIQVQEGSKLSKFFITYQSDIEGGIIISQFLLPYHTNWNPRPYLFSYINNGDSRYISTNPNVVAFFFSLSKSSNFAIQVQHYQDPQLFRFIPEFAEVINKQKAKLEGEFLRVYYAGNRKNVIPYEFNCAFNSYSQMMSGLQFSYGNLLCVQDSLNCKQRKGMLSHTPSRVGFPRPFLWDEGFHNELSCWMRPYICLQSLTDWLGSMSEDGWIPREQPRGEELRSYIPGLLEDKRESNPPTFFFNFELLLTNFPEDEMIKARIGELYPKLSKWYQSWFNTQAVHDEFGLFDGFLKWWGPTENFNFGSGMDDWPRIHRNQVSKYNVDAQSWGYFLSQKMLQLTIIYDSENQDFIDLLQDRVDLIDERLHMVLLDPRDNLFKDILYEREDEDRTNLFSPHLGYPNFLPLAMGLIDPSDDKLIEAQIYYMSNSSTIFTQYGLRSLDMNDEYFGLNDNYWRGPIWVNFHYLILRGISLYYMENDVARNFYEQLRKVIINNVCGNFEQTGYFFEHYNQELDGFGHGNHPFNGWTSTISLIISEKY